MSTPIKKKEDFTSFNLDNRYKEELTESLPILNYEGLLELVINYCNELKSCEKPDKESYIRDTVLSKILKLLRGLKNIVINYNINNNKNKYIKEIKEIDVNGLIQAIILCTVKYYDEDISVSMSSLNIRNNSIYLKMNRATGVTFAQYILDLYQDNEITNFQKDKTFIDILKLISFKLENLQIKGGFIHGDFHADNIMIDENKKITFIDFQYSVIRLPTKNRESIILCGTESVNLKRKDILDISNDPKLKAIDLYHLIIYIEKLNKEKYYNALDNIIDKIKNLCFNGKINSSNIKKYSNPHEFTSSYNFIKNSNNLENLYPENFKNIEFDSDKLYIKRVSINNNSNKYKFIKTSNNNNHNNNNNNNNIYNFKRYT